MKVSKHVFSLFFLILFTSFLNSCGKTEFANGPKEEANLGPENSEGDAKGKIEPTNPIVGGECSSDKANSCQKSCAGEMIGGICYDSMLANACPNHGKPGHICTKELCGHDQGPYCGGECVSGNCGGACKDGCENGDGSTDYIVNFFSGEVTHAKVEMNFGNNGVAEEVKLDNKIVIQNYDEKFIANYDKQEDIYTYACYCDGWNGAFVTLTKKPFANSITVSVGGNATTDFTYDSANNRINFKNQLGTVVVIKVNYNVDAPLKSEFLLQLVGARTLLQDTLKAKLNGVDTEILSYNAKTKIVKIKDVPAINGSEVVFSYQTSEIGGPQLEYKLNFSGGSVNNLSVVDAVTKEEIGHTYENGILIIEEEFYVKDRKIIASYVKALSADGYISLTGAPQPETLVVKGIAKDSSEQECAKDKIEIKDKSIKLLCDLPSAEKVRIEYDYVTGLLSSFTIDGIANPDAAKWTVLVDGRIRADFVREGNIIKFAEPLPLGAVVMIKAHLPKQ